MKNLRPFLVLAPIVLVLNYFIQSFDLAFWPEAILTLMAVFAASAGVFKGFQDPVPAALSTSEIKVFFKSKIFWIALLNLVSVCLKGIFNIDLDVETQTEILSLDWTNLIQALLSVALIVIRKFDVLKYLA